MIKTLLALALGLTVTAGFAADTATTAPAATAKDEAPAAVAKAAAALGTVEKIEKKSKDGKVSYEAKIKGADGKDKMVKFDETGKEIVEAK